MLDGGGCVDETVHTIIHIGNLMRGEKLFEFTRTWFSNIKLGHALSFHMRGKVFLQFFSRKYWVSIKI